MNNKNKRGWFFDQLMMIGHAEAALCHGDENICNDYHDIQENDGELDTINRLGDDLAARTEIMKIDYENRVDMLNQLFDEMPGSNRHYYCDVKHRCADFVIAAEVYHARGFTPEAERVLVRCGRSLAMTCSMAFGFEVMDCLRCLSEAANVAVGDEPTVVPQDNMGDQTLMEPEQPQLSYNGRTILDT